MAGELAPTAAERREPLAFTIGPATAWIIWCAGGNSTGSGLGTATGAARPGKPNHQSAILESHHLEHESAELCTEFLPHAGHARYVDQIAALERILPEVV